MAVKTANVTARIQPNIKEQAEADQQNADKMCRQKLFLTDLEFLYLYL